jgi:hypothetical protein
MVGLVDPNLCKNATEYTNNHEYKYATEITLHFINIKELIFFYNEVRRPIYYWESMENPKHPKT